MTFDPDAPLTHRRTGPEQLILELGSMWLDRYDRHQNMPRGPRMNPADAPAALWNATAAGLVDAWTAIYLLALLREHAPGAAAHAARVLNQGPVGVPRERMPLLVREWAAAAAEGRTLRGLLP